MVASCHNWPVQPPRTITVTRYVTPLREGGSLPAIVEADDDGLYVLKFRGAGQGPRALIAELLAGELARALGLPVPEIVFATLDPDLARTEPDPEIHALIRESAGLNLAIDYLPGSVTFDPIVHTLPSALAARILWFDAFVSNIDRTARNTNMLIWNRQPWLIDHGASLYFHHADGWEGDAARPRAAFPQIATHVLRGHASDLATVDAASVAALSATVIAAIAGWIPDAWLDTADAPRVPADARAAYQRYLVARLAAPRVFIEELHRGD